MSSSWLVIALALSVASFSEGKTANLVLLTDAPGQSVSTTCIIVSIQSQPKSTTYLGHA